MDKKAQSTVEYIIMVTAVIAVAIIVLGPSGVFSQRLSDSIGQASNGMYSMVNKVLPP